jgi:Flp pilus assembly protein TadG
MTFRRNEEKGQALVLTVVCLAVMLGMAALVLDVGAWFRTDRHLQATADAAALAGAQDLPTDVAGAKAAALDYANKNGGNVAAGDISVTTTASPNDTIVVKASKTDPGFFSKILGIDTVNINAHARARADVPVQVRYVAPMVVSCNHDLVKNCNNNGKLPDYGVPTTLDFDKMGAPGAFGMLNLSKSGGTPGTSEEAEWILRGYDALLDVNKNYRSDPGAKFSSSQIQAALESRLTQGVPLLFPVFEKDKSLKDGGGQITEYYIIGWIAFHLTSYEIHGHNATLHGYFTGYIASGILSSAGPGSPNYGVKSIQLIE